MKIKYLKKFSIGALLAGTAISLASPVFSAKAHADSRVDALEKEYSYAGQLTDIYGVRYTTTFKGKVPDSVYVKDAYSKPNRNVDTRVIPGDGNDILSFEYTDKNGKHNDRDEYTEDTYGEYDNNTFIEVGLNDIIDKYVCYKRHWEGTTSDSYRHFKNRSANIYVQDKKLLPMFKKAAKEWAPVFKFKFVNSAKHASFTSSKYANVVVYRDPNRKTTDLTVHRQLEQSKDAVKGGEVKYTNYEDGKIVNYKLYKKVPYYGSVISHGEAPARGMWVPTRKDASKKQCVHHYNLIVGEKMSKSNQLVATTRLLGNVIGLGDIPQRSIMDVTDKKVTQGDLDAVDWLYKHPYTGINPDYESQR